MLKTIETYTLSSGKKIKCYDMTMGLIDAIAEDNENDTPLNVILDATDLNEEQYAKLRRSDTKGIYDTVIRLTYPELFNEDGSQKEIQDEENDKKKA